jgi:DNA-binding transcriptional LysR family regulator
MKEKREPKKEKRKPKKEKRKPMRSRYREDLRVERGRFYHKMVTLAEWLQHDTLERAAASLGISLRSASSDLKLLPEQLGVELMTDGHEPTQHAEELRPVARDLTSAFRVLRALTQARSVRVAMTSHINWNYLPQILADDEVRVMLENGGLRLAALDRRADRIPEAVLSGEADIGVGPLDDTVTKGGLNIERNSYFQSQLLVISRPREGSEEHSFGWDELLRERLILHERGTATRLAIERAWDARNKGATGATSGVLLPAVEVTDAMLMLELVAAGHGTGITAKGPAIREYAKRNGLKISPAPIHDAEEVRVGVMTRAAGLTNAAAKTIATTLFKVLERELGAPTRMESQWKGATANGAASSAISPEADR